jgi:hypothetical protein
MFTLVMMFVLVFVVVLVRAGARVAPDLGAQGRGLSVIVIALPGSLSCLLSSAGGAAAHSNVVIIHDDGHVSAAITLALVHVRVVVVATIEPMEVRGDVRGPRGVLALCPC